MSVRRIAIVSAGRSDRGHLTPVYEALRPDVFWLATFSNPQGDADPREIGAVMARVVDWYSAEINAARPDLILLFGDRYEQMAAAMASLPFAIPLAHVHGGDVTAGAFDNQIRNALTKMAHLHFVANEDAKARVLAMGEEEWRVHVTGSPGVDRLRAIPVPQHPIHSALVTLHPCTLEYEQTETLAMALVDALRDVGLPFMWTAANADTHGSKINHILSHWLGPPREFEDHEYIGLMASSVVMVGNSSSGIIEAPSFRLPVVNIGRRQHGRVRGDNVIDVGTTCEEIAEGIRRALKPAFRASLSGVNPYGDGHAAPRIAEMLRTVPLDRGLVEKE